MEKREVASQGHCLQLRALASQSAVRVLDATQDGVPVIVHWRRDGSTWRPHAAIRLWWQGGTVVRIRDYIHVDYLLTDWAVRDQPVAPPSAPTIE